MSPVISDKDNRVVWIDCEMTGLDVQRDVLVEIAVIVTDAELNPLDDGIDIVISATQQQLDGMDDFVRNMHESSGLTEEIKASTVTVREAEEQVLQYVKRFVPQARTAPIAGNSIGTDKAFLQRYMPELTEHLHYRMIDVSTLKELCKRWYPRIYFGQPAKGMTHRALQDIEESIRELRYYRATALVEQPGPTTEQVTEISDAM